MDIPTDPTTVAVYALMYFAAIAVIILLLLPILLMFVVLLFTAGAVQAVAVILKVATVGLVRGIAGLFRHPGQRHRPGGHGGRLVPH
jgi:hypothetical protein